MKTTALFMFMLLLALFYTTHAAKSPLCTACPLVVGVLSGLARELQTNISDAVNFWCESLGGDQQFISDICKVAIGSFSDKIQPDYDQGRSPDYTCKYSLQFCEESYQCHLYPQTTADQIAIAKLQSIPKQTPIPKSYAHYLFEDQFSHEYDEVAKSIFDFILSGMTGWSKIGGIKRLEDYDAILQHKPILSSKVTGGSRIVKAAVDDDGDGSSTFQQLRGSDWRGKDCNDKDDTVYPGRLDASGKGADIDHNCNGIYGVDTDGVSFEDKWCKDTPGFEVNMIGDSATAHFTIPECYVNPQCIARAKHLYKDLLNVAMNELDFPSCAIVTGFNETGCPSLFQSISKFQSVYSFARQQNPCIHRQFHNIGINGADSVSMSGIDGKDGQILSYKRNPKTDMKQAIFIALIGNDVCGSDPSPASMTDPDVFKSGWIKTLDYIDTQVPAGSYVWAGGLVDGRLLYDIMHDREHPIGGIKYDDLYRFLNCEQHNPCAGWLHPDQSVRDATTAHARKLNDKLKEVVAMNKWKNFKIFYNDYEGQIASKLDWAKSKGYPLDKMIAAVDSFHPSSTTNALLAQSFIDKIMLSEGAEIFKLNPHTDEIFAKFGRDLNGY